MNSGRHKCSRKVVWQANEVCIEERSLGPTYSHSNDETGPTFLENQDEAVEVEAQLRRGGWRSATFIIVQHLLALVAYSGVSRSLVRYLTTVMHMGNATAAKIVMNFSGTSYITPLFGAMMADSSLGRFRTSVIFAFIFSLGLGLITLSGNVASLTPPQCPTMDTKCASLSGPQMAFLFLGIYTISVGRGGYPAYAIFGASQFDEEESRSSFFIYFYQALSLGYTISAIFLVYIQEHAGYGVGYFVAAGASLLSLASLLGGIPFYLHQQSTGNAASKVIQVWIACTYKWRLHNPPNDELFEDGHMDRRRLHTDTFNFLDKAAVVTPADQLELPLRNQWRLCSVTQVEEVKCLLRLMPICATCIIFTSVYVQLATLFVLQGATMDRTFGPLTIPSPTLTVFEGVSVLVCGFLYDRLLVPITAKFTGLQKGITPLKRIGIGLCLSVFAMVVAAMVEQKRLSMATDGVGNVPMSIFFLVPQYFLVGAGEVFTYIGLTEFFYDQSPESLRSVGSSVSMFTQALGNYFSSVLVSVVCYVSSRGGAEPGWIPDNLNSGHVDRFYLLMAILCTVNVVVFWLIAVRYEEQGKTKVNDCSLTVPLLKKPLATTR